MSRTYSTPSLSPRRRLSEPEATTPLPQKNVDDARYPKPPLGANQSHVLWAWLFTPLPENTSIPKSNYSAIGHYKYLQIPL